MLLIGVVVLILLITSLSGLARFWTDYLWFQSVGFTSVFRGVLVTKVLLALVFIALFFVLLFGNLVIADRVAPDEPAQGWPTSWSCATGRSSVRHARIVRIVTSIVFAVLAGIGANREWNNWDLLRYHVSFGVTDPQYHKDVGFYVFELPFIKFLLGWAFEAIIVVFIVTAVAHYLNGGIHLQGSERRVTSAVKTHLSVLLGVLALIKAVDYYFQRLELVLSRTHVVNGATATNVHADQPARTLLIAIAVIAAGLFLYNIRQKGWTLPIVAVGLWVLVYILVGAAYPALYQALRGQAVRTDPGSAVHPAQHRRHPRRLWPGQDDGRLQLHVQPDRDPVGDPGQHLAGAGQPADPRQRPAARSGRQPQEHLRQVPGPARSTTSSTTWTWTATRWTPATARR